MDKRELHKAVREEMVFAANKVASLRELERSIIKEIDYWTQQEEAARVVSIRLDIQASQEASNFGSPPCNCPCCRLGVEAPNEYHLERRQMPINDTESCKS